MKIMMDGKSSIVKYIYIYSIVISNHQTLVCLACYQVSHTCNEICGYCAKDGDRTVRCSDKCGHSGKHNCRKKPHTWYVKLSLCNILIALDNIYSGKKCSLSEYGGCQENCMLYEVFAELLHQ